MAPGRDEDMRESSGGRHVAVPDLIGGLLVIAVGAAFAVGSLQYGTLGEGGRLAPGAMPFFSGAILAAFGLGVIGTALRDAVRSGSAPPAGDEDTREHDQATESPGPQGEVAEAGAGERADGPAPPPPEESNDPTRALVVFALTVVAAVVGQWIGFLLAFGLLIVVLLAVLERERLWLAVAVTVGALVFAYFIFVEFLGVPLPEGPLF